MPGRLPVCVVGVTLLTCACTSHENPSLPPRPTTQTSTEPQSAVDAAYQQYWQVEHVTMQLPESEWPAAIDKVAAGAQADRVLEGFRSLRAQSLTLYGAVTAHVSHIDITGDQATVQDCQDASHAGQADVATGKPKTVGVPRSPVSATLMRGADGQWRVTGVSYPGGTC